MSSEADKMTPSPQGLNTYMVPPHNAQCLVAARQTVSLTNIQTSILQPSPASCLKELSQAINPFPCFERTVGHQRFVLKSLLLHPQREHLREWTHQISSASSRCHDKRKLLPARNCFQDVLPDVPYAL